MAGDTYTIHRYNLMYPLYLRDKETVLGSLDGSRIEIPVHHIVKIVKSRDDETREDKFIAIHPELRQILEVPFIEQVERAVRREQAAINLLKMAEASMSCFNSLPWWKRGLKAIFHGVRI
jgi:hypothetical protein